MLNNIEIEVLEQLLENDRLQKQLFQELCTQILDDDHGIPQGAYDTLCELADTFGLIIEGIDRIGSCDGRVYMKEEIPEELNPPILFVVNNVYTEDQIWDWAEQQDIATIEDISFRINMITDTKHIIIHLQWADQNTDDAKMQLESEFKQYYGD